MPTEELIVSLWNRRVAWSRAADRLKASIERTRSAALILSSLGAVLETIAATTVVSMGRVWYAGAGAAALALVPPIRGYFLTSEHVRDWTRARSVSNALTAEIYLFRAGATPYNQPDAATTLNAKCHELLNAVMDLESYVRNIDPQSNTVPPSMNSDDYITRRVVQQVNEYYRPRAAIYARRRQRLRWAEIALAIAATALGAFAAALAGAASGAGMAAWVSVLTTVGGALAAHAAAGRLDFLVTSFLATARRLEDLVNGWRVAGAPIGSPQWSEFVRQCESAISAENESWLAKWADGSEQQKSD